MYSAAAFVGAYKGDENVDLNASWKLSAHIKMYPAIESVFLWLRSFKVLLKFEYQTFNKSP